MDRNFIFTEIVCGIEGSAADLNEIARQIGEISIEGPHLSKQARLAIAAYVGLLVFSICVWLCIFGVLDIRQGILDPPINRILLVIQATCIPLEQDFDVVTGPLGHLRRRYARIEPCTQCGVP